MAEAFIREHPEAIWVQVGGTIRGQDGDGIRRRTCAICGGGGRWQGGNVGATPAPWLRTQQPCWGACLACEARVWPRIHRPMTSHSTFHSPPSYLPCLPRYLPNTLPQDMPTNFLSLRPFPLCLFLPAHRSALSLQTSCSRWASWSTQWEERRASTWPHTTSQVTRVGWCAGWLAGSWDMSGAASAAREERS